MLSLMVMPLSSLAESLPDETTTVRGPEEAFMETFTVNCIVCGFGISRLTISIPDPRSTVAVAVNPDPLTTTGTDLPPSAREFGVIEVTLSVLTGGVTPLSFPLLHPARTHASRKMHRYRVA